MSVSSLAMQLFTYFQYVFFSGILLMLSTVGVLSCEVETFNPLTNSDTLRLILQELDDSQLAKVAMVNSQWRQIVANELISRWNQTYKTELETPSNLWSHNKYHHLRICDFNMFKKLQKNSFLWPFLTRVRLEWIYGLVWRDADFWRKWLNKMPQVKQIQSHEDYFCIHSTHYFNEEMTYLKEKNIEVILDK